MQKMELKISKEDLEKLGNEKIAIRNYLLSLAVYNESLDYDFTDEEKIMLEHYMNREMINIYVRSELEPKLMINENQIINSYTENKKYFEENNISFKDAHDIIKERLMVEQFQEMLGDFILEKLNQMTEEISFKPNEILATKGDAELLKQLVVNKILTIDAVKNKFFKNNEKILELAKKDFRINFFTKIITTKDMRIEKAEVEKIYEDNKKDYENIEKEEALNQIAIRLSEIKGQNNLVEYSEKIIKKYDINTKVDEILNGRI